MAPRTCVSPDELGISLPTNANAPRAREVRPRAERFAGRPRIVKPKRASWWSSTFPRRAGLCIVSGYESVHVKDALAHPSGLVLDMAVRAGSDSTCPRRGNKCSHPDWTGKPELIELAEACASKVIYHPIRQLKD